MEERGFGLSLSLDLGDLAFFRCFAPSSPPAGELQGHGQEDPGLFPAGKKETLLGRYLCYSVFHSVLITLPYSIPRLISIQALIIVTCDLSSDLIL